MSSLKTAFLFSVVFVLPAYVLAPAARAQWGSVSTGQYVNNVADTDYHDDGDELAAAAAISYNNTTGSTQYVWIVIEMWADGVMLDSSGETKEVANNSTDAPSGVVNGVVHEPLPDQVEIRI